MPCNQSESDGTGAKLGGIVASGTAVIEGLRGKLRLNTVAGTEGWARSWMVRALAAAVRAFLVMILIVMPSVILPGINVADGTIVSAGAVVTQDTAPYTIVGGVPARQIGERPRDTTASVPPRLSAG